jgi:hypothetical protein
MGRSYMNNICCKLVNTITTLKLGTLGWITYHVMSLPGFFSVFVGCLKSIRFALDKGGHLNVSKLALTFC